MHGLQKELIRRGVFDVLIAVAIGYALVLFVENASSIATDAIAQHVVNRQGDPLLGEYDPLGSSYQLNFHLGSTVIFYGAFLESLLTLLVVLLLARLLRRARERTLGRCPYCLTSIVLETEVCPACASAVLPAET
jgi:hypothetical protein